MAVMGKPGYYFLSDDKNVQLLPLEHGISLLNMYIQSCTWTVITLLEIQAGRIYQKSRNFSSNNFKTTYNGKESHIYIITVYLRN